MSVDILALWVIFSLSLKIQGADAAGSCKKSTFRRREQDTYYHHMAMQDK